MGGNSGIAWSPPLRQEAAGAPLEAALVQLGAAELIFARGEPPKYDVHLQARARAGSSVASLLHSKRLRLHSQIVEALNEHFPETIKSHPELMGYHLAAAGLTERAIEYFQKAGELAIQRSGQR